MKIRYFGPFALETGYSRAASDYLEALLTAGVDLDIIPIIDGKERTLEERYHNLLPYVNRQDIKDPGWPDVIIVHAIPHGCTLFLDKELNPPPHVKRVALTTWETSKLPVDISTELLKTFDQVWLPSTYSADAIGNYVRCCNTKGDSKLRVVPHAFDPKFWGNRVRPFRDFDIDPYVFYTILTWCERKNPIGLLKAYLTEFGPEDNVLLKIRTPGYNEREINELVRGLALPYLPPVDILCDYLSEDGILDLHLDSDCYVTCARAEGFGLGAFEACLVGNPVIAPAYSGLTEFLFSYPNVVDFIDAFDTPAYVPESDSNSEINIAGLSIKPVLRNTHTGICGDQMWAEPDLGGLKRLMRETYTYRTPKGRFIETGYLERFTYAKIGEQMLNNLEELCESPSR